MTPLTFDELRLANLLRIQQDGDHVGEHSYTLQERVPYNSKTEFRIGTTRVLYDLMACTVCRNMSLRVLLDTPDPAPMLAEVVIEADRLAAANHIDLAQAIRDRLDPLKSGEATPFPSKITQGPTI